MCSQCDGNEYRETIEADARRRRRETEQIEPLDGPEQAAKDAYFQALLEDSFYRQKFNLAPRRIA